MVLSRYFSGPSFVIEVAEGFSGQDDKKRHRTFRRAFRTLSLASPPAFIDPALVPGDLYAVQPVVREGPGPALFRSSQWATAGKFSVEHDDILQ